MSRLVSASIIDHLVDLVTAPHFGNAYICSPPELTSVLIPSSVFLADCKACEMMAQENTGSN